MGLGLTYSLRLRFWSLRRPAEMDVVEMALANAFVHFEGLAPQILESWVGVTGISLTKLASCGSSLSGGLGFRI